VLPVKAGKGPQRLTRQVERLAQGHPTLLIKNPNQFLVTDSDPVAGFFELLSEIRRQLKNNTGRWVQMGDWVHLLYENVEPLVKIEHGINDIKGLDSVLCCYRIEGFCTMSAPGPGSIYSPRNDRNSDSTSLLVSSCSAMFASSKKTGSDF